MLRRGDVEGDGMSRVCVIRCHYFRDTRLQREVAALLDRGHAVHVLCLRSPGEPLRERRQRLSITRLPVRHPAGAGVARRLAEYVTFFALAGLGVTALHLRRPFDLVQVNSVPDVLVFAALLPRCTGARVLLDVQEPLPEFFSTKIGVGERHPAVRLIAELEQASIRFADATLTVTEQMRQAFVARGTESNKITVVMDGSDEEVFDPTRFPTRTPDENKFVLVSHGTIEPQYGLDTAIRAVAKLAEVIPSIELRIVGDGSRRAELQTLACRLGVSDRILFSQGFIPIDELVATLARCDVGVVAMKRDRFRDLTLAGKMFDYIAMGVPMVVARTRSVLETFPAGSFETFESGDPTDLARAIERLHGDPNLARSFSMRAKDAARPFSWSAQRQRYWDVVDSLIDPAPTTDPSLSVTLTSQPDPSVLIAWDELVRKVPDSDVAQLSAWADVRRAAGFQPLYVLVRRTDELVGGALIMSRKLALVGDVGYVPYGPVIARDADRDPIIAALVTALRRLTERQMSMLFVQPPAGAGDISLALRRGGFRPSHAGVAPVASLRLDLARDEGDLFAGLRKEHRKKSRRWQDLGVQVRRGAHDDVPILARLHAATAQHHGFSPIPLDYIANLYQRLAPAGHAVLFVGEVDGRPVCTKLLTGCGGVLKGRLTGMDRDPATSSLGVPAAVMWEAIRWAKANGYHWFDLGGISESAASILDRGQQDQSGLTGPECFKLGFGGTVFRYPAPAEIISSALVRSAYDLSQRMPAGRRLVERTSHSLRAGRRR